MVAEITTEKRYQSRAFLLLPMSFNIAGILGPSKNALTPARSPCPCHADVYCFQVIGGMLADPIKTLPGLFGEQGSLDFAWIRSHPFALPSLVNALFLSIATVVVFLFLEEVRHPF